jgi:anaerobic selenocysteine-containing dehydrogenase
MAMLSLNALLGAIDRDQHMVSPLEELVRLPPLPQGLPGQKIERLDRQRFPLAADAPWALPEAIGANPDAVSALFLYYSNPLASHPGGSAWAEALARIPLIVSFSPFLDETSAHADWILPESTCLERYQEFVHPPVSSMGCITVTQPMWDEPLYDTRPTGDVPALRRWSTRRRSVSSWPTM